MEERKQNQNEEMKGKFSHQAYQAQFHLPRSDPFLCLQHSRVVSIQVKQNKMINLIVVINFLV